MKSTKKKPVCVKVEPEPDSCAQCGGFHFVHEPNNERTKCSSCGAYMYDWVQRSDLLQKLSGERKPRDCVRSPSFAPPELLDFTKTDLVDLVWCLAELHTEPTLVKTLLTIVDEYNNQRETQVKKSPLPRRLRELLERLQEKT